MDPLSIGIGAVAGLIAGGVVTNVLINSSLKKKNKDAESEAEQIKQRVIDEGRAEVAKLKADDAEAQLKRRQEVDKEIKKSQDDLRAVERRLAKREDLVDSKMAAIEKKESGIGEMAEKQKALLEEAEKIKGEIKGVLDEQRKKLESVSGLSPEKAKELLLDQVERENATEVNELTKRAIQHAKNKAEEESRKIIMNVIQRIVPDQVAENTVTSIEISSDELKGRIIGREGRNIRAFEKATGVDVVVDDTPGVVVLSGFEPVRREIARIAMDRLVQDGRIHPTRIEEAVQKAEKDIMTNINKMGSETAIEFGCHDLHPKLIEMMGRLHYRTSYGQRVLAHSREVANICGLLAGELKLDVQLAKRCGLLHDCGKSIDQEQEGTHPQLGMDVAIECKEKQEVYESIGGHHGDIEVNSLYPILVTIADAISAARPGARRESYERYVQRMKKLEEIATNRKGIDKAFAVQAGREVRVLAKADKMTDRDCAKTARDIAKMIEKELSYPGEVKITMIRETRFVEYAR